MSCRTGAVYTFAVAVAQHVFLGRPDTFHVAALASPPSRARRQPTAGLSRGPQGSFPLGAAAAGIDADVTSGDEAAGSESSGGSGGGERKQSLYDILGAPPDATKADLKRQYVLLARETHPDALIGREDDGTAAADGPDFNEIASAWRVLSDPMERKRYDRSLQADRFVESTEKWAGKVGESAGQVISETLDNVAVPLYKKVITTWGSIAEEIVPKEQTEDKEDTDLRSAFMSAVDVAKRAGDAINRSDMLEKSEDLKERAELEAKAAEAIKKELADVMQNRLEITLKTPNSDISSLEAMKLLDGLNTVDSRSIKDLVMLRNTVTNEINALEKVEASYFLKYDEKVQSEMKYEQTSDALKQAEINSASAMDAERRATEALRAAKELVASTSKAVTECSNALASIETVKENTVQETDKLSSALNRRQERVRLALRRKEEAILNKSFLQGKVDEYKSGMALIEPEAEASGAAFEKNVQQLEELRKKERFLMAEGARLENRALRLQSRADKLKARADFMKGSQDDE